MADKYTAKAELSSGGLGIEAWMDAHFRGKPGAKVGPVICCSDLDGNKKYLPSGSVGILFQDCKMMRKGTTGNHGTAGSNAVTGDPVMFVELDSVFPAVFRGKSKGILSSISQGFVLPLALLNEASDMNTFAKEAHAEFICQQHGGVSHDITHIANGLCCALSSTCFNLSLEININGKTPKEERLRFLIMALHYLGKAARSAALKYPAIDNVFQLMPYSAKSCDTLQSTMISFVFKETPAMSIRVKHFGNSIFRNFKYEGRNVSYISKFPSGLIALLLVAPMLAELISNDNCVDPTTLVNKIITVINKAVAEMAELIAETDFEELSAKKMKEAKMTSNYYVKLDKYEATHLENKLILTHFAKCCEEPLIPADLLEKIYDAVLDGQQDIGKAIGISEYPFFMEKDAKLTLNNKYYNNYPIMIKDRAEGQSYKERDLDDFGITATFIPAEPREWTGVLLIPGNYLVRCTPLGNSSFKKGNTLGEDFVCNFRITAGTINNCELLLGKYSGFASTGIVYTNQTDNYGGRFSYNEPKLSASKIEPTKDVHLNYSAQSIQILQSGVELFKIPFDVGFSSQSSPPQPLIAFKYCRAEITLIKKYQPPQPPMTGAKGSQFGDELTADWDDFQSSSSFKTSSIYSCNSLSEAVKKAKDAKRDKSQKKK